ncbi:hypothetical protein TWF281_004328 [Arthrobotrys megalospora]
MFRLQTTTTKLLLRRIISKMSDTDLSSMGFTSFGKTPKHHQTAPIHANPTPLPSSLPPRPPPQSPSQGNQGYQNQGQFHRGRGGGGGGGGGRGNWNYRGNFDSRGGGRGGGGPHRRGFHSNSPHQRGGRGGRHHHPYPHRQSHNQGDHQHQHHQQERDFSTSNTPAYRSKDFGEGLYKPSMNDDPWAPLIKNKQPQQQQQGDVSTAAAGTGDVWMEENKSTRYDKPEDKAADGGGWNADEIDLGDD